MDCGLRENVVCFFGVKINDDEPDNEHEPPFCESTDEIY